MSLQNFLRYARVSIPHGPQVPLKSVASVAESRCGKFLIVKPFNPATIASINNTLSPAVRRTIIPGRELRVFLPTSIHAEQSEGAKDRRISNSVTRLQTRSVKNLMEAADMEVDRRNLMVSRRQHAQQQRTYMMAGTTKARNKFESLVRDLQGELNRSRAPKNRKAVRQAIKNNTKIEFETFDL